MKHASQHTLETIAVLLNQVRELPGVREKKLGVFYYKSKAFLHFHEDPAGIFADIRLDGSEFERYPVNTSPQRHKLVNAARRFLNLTT